MQGYLLARPAFESLPDFTLPRTQPRQRRASSVRTSSWLSIVQPRLADNAI